MWMNGIHCLIKVLNSSRFSPEPITKLTDKWLSKLKAKYGVYAVLGNHDYKAGLKANRFISETLIDAGIQLLGSELCRPIPNEPLLELIGLGDVTYRWKDFNVERAFQEANDDPRVTRIVMSHNPDTAKLFAGWKVDLQVSGHTHGGQICLPWNGKPLLRYLRALYSCLPKQFRIFFPPQIFSLNNWDWVSGLHCVARTDTEIGFNNLYVSKGLATHPPARFCCPPELTVVTLFSSTRTER
eukprot:TRINITY_DN3496_c0_g1_i3.p1 TRINITY_DN3496_c0_g1~~TRINITY_DN3496_c0_g1_i3.p1  ORF type:complete len:241 (-),score=29.37 TRINITY_DN3496_c0_g1_i3:421-1143(-)